MCLFVVNVLGGMMKVNKSFVEAYDAMFAYILKEYGLDDLIKFWKGIAPTMLRDLKDIANQKGILGCKQYWDKILKEEGAKFRTNIKDGVLKLEITDCPSIRHLNTPACSEYCRHCGVMYPEVLSCSGLDMECKRVGNGRCEIVVRERK